MNQPIEWIDYGWWKNWESPWGDIGIEQRPSYCDRGVVVIKTMTHGAVNLLFNPLLSNAYFFDEDRAMKHLIKVTQIAANLSDEQIRNLDLQPTGKLLLFEGKDCTCELGTFALHPTEIQVTAFGVKVHPDKKTNFVDSDDMFPRYYVDRDIAKAELNAWMQQRGQSVESDRPFTP
jgi:hypothetical protein